MRQPHNYFLNNGYKMVHDLRQALAQKSSDIKREGMALGKKNARRWAKALGQKARHYAQSQGGWKAELAGGLSAGLAAAENMHVPQSARAPQARLQLKKGKKSSRNNPNKYAVGHNRPDGGIKSAPSTHGSRPIASAAKVAADFRRWGRRGQGY